jgi:signal transduction histidine kinase
VQIRGYVEQDRACVSVTDQGPGISDDDQKKMFGKFTRLSAKPTGGESSNGLGLSIVKRLAEGMKGSVECRSVLGAGATFTIRLPIWNGVGSASMTQPPQKNSDSPT